MNIKKVLPLSLRALLRKVFCTVGVVIKNGTLSPSSVLLCGAENRIFVDSNDPRVQMILIPGTVLYVSARPRLFWGNVVRKLQPTIALDVGLNYGECLFTPRYHSGVRLFGFEANPALQDYVSRSRESHPSRDQIELVFGLVSEVPGGVASFFVNSEWSGVSSAVGDVSLEQGGVIRKVLVPVVSVDSSVCRDGVVGQSDTLLFKIDIEGYEFHALRGMVETLSRVAWAIGFIEFDTALLVLAGESPLDCVDWLVERFEVFGFDSSESLHAVKNLSDLQALFPEQNIHTDLVLVSKGAPSHVREQAIAPLKYGR